MITIGSDPEFGLEDEQGNQAMAYRYLPGGAEEIGVDGHSDIGELRPKYSETPRGHLIEVAKLMSRVSEMVPSHIKITAGSMARGNDPIGGHIHFGVRKRTFDIPKAARALDYYLALPVAMIEVQSSAKYRRTQSSYGHLGAWREQRHGFEYRTLPSWLTGWGVALSILSIGYAVVDAVRQKSCPNVPKHIPDPKEFNNCNKKAMRPLLNQIRRGWRELPLYSEFRLEIAYLNHLLVHGMEWREQQDVRGWWPAKGKRKPNRQHLVLGNPNDVNCPEIAQMVRGVTGMKIFIYGLSPEREPDIAVSDTSIVSGLSINYTISDITFGVAREREHGGWLCIGLSLELRQDVRAAADLINDILKTERDAERFRIEGTQRYRGPTGQFQSRQQILDTQTDNQPGPF